MSDDGSNTGHAIDAHVASEATLPNGTYDAPERELALHVTLEALDAADSGAQAVDGLYVPKPRPWTDQGFFSAWLIDRLGARPARTIEAHTGGTSAAHAMHAAVDDVRTGTVETAVVCAAERNSSIETTDYFDYILGIFDREFQSPAGPSIPAIYAQSMQRYCHDYGVNRELLAAIAAKNRSNGARNPDALSTDLVTSDDVLDSRLVADPLRLLECPPLCDGAAAVVVTADPGPKETTVRVSGLGERHEASHLIGQHQVPLSQFPAVGDAADEAVADAGTAAGAIDVIEVYAPFPHVEAVAMEELDLCDRGEGAAVCLREEPSGEGPSPVSPSGGCLGRGHPAMVTPLLNYVEATRQLRGEAANQVADVRTALATSEHGHVDGATATILEAGR